MWTRRRCRHWTRVALVATSSLTVLFTAACGAGPSDRPGVAMERPHEAGGEPKTPPAPPAPPAVEQPKTDLAWHDCAAPTFNLLGLGAPPPGLIFECAEYSTPIDVGGAILGTFHNAAVRARLPQTPADAAPLVLTSGSDRSSTATLAGLATGPQAPVLAAHPIVGVDRRGTGSSQPVDCMTPDTRRALADNGQFTPAGGDPVDTVATLSKDATIACQDFLQPYQSTFDSAHAADDIEQLRKQWQVDHIALIGTGNGGRVATSYAAKYGDHLGRLVLDSPEAVNADAAGRAEQRTKGAEAALTAFAQRCAAIGCALGPNPETAVADLVHRAETGGLGEISANSLLTTISGFLGDPRADQITHVTELADALAAAGSGDRGPLSNLALRESAAVGSDGQFVARCSDNQQPAPPTRARELENTWGAQYPVFGKAAAAQLQACTAWPATDAAQLPKKLTTPVLVLGAAADPVVGGDGRPAVTGVFAAAGARTASVDWQGWGHPTFPHTPCAQQYVINYVADAKLPRDGSACPAE